MSTEPVKGPASYFPSIEKKYGRPIDEWQQLVREVILAPHVQDYVARLTLATHPDGPFAPPITNQYLRWGSSPRGAQTLTLAAKVRALNSGLLPGFKIPTLDAGTVATDDCPIDDALARLERAWARLDRNTPTYEHPFFGPLTRDEWLKLHFRHS